MTTDLFLSELGYNIWALCWRKKKLVRSQLFLLYSYHSLCVQDAVPLTFKSCVIAKDCETSEWSAWSACSQTCSWGELAPGFRSRRRGVQSLAVGTGKLCPELEEREACSAGGRELLQPCPRYLRAFVKVFWRTPCSEVLLCKAKLPCSKSMCMCGEGHTSWLVSVSERSLI